MLIAFALSIRVMHLPRDSLRKNFCHLQLDSDNPQTTRLYPPAYNVGPPNRRLPRNRCRFLLSNSRNWYLCSLCLCAKPVNKLKLASYTACGLYYLSEIVEEHTVLSKKILTRLIQAIIGIHVLLIILDGFPVLLTLFSAASNAVYMLNLRKFPFVKLSDGVFIASCRMHIIFLFAKFMWKKT